MSSIGGPEDFTLNIIDNMRRNKPSFSHTNEEQLTESSIPGPEDFTADLLRDTRRRQDSDASQRSRGHAIASRRKVSAGSVKTTQSSPSNSPIQSPNHRSASLLPAMTARDGEQLQAKRSSSAQSATASARAQGEAGSTTPIKEVHNDIPLDDIGAVSVIIKDGEMYRKNIRAGVRQKMQPTVSDDDDERIDKADIANAMNPPSSSPIQPEPTTAIPTGLLDDEITRPLGESTPTQRTLDFSPTSSKEHTLEDGFDFATSLAHRIQRTPASSARKPEAEYTLDLSADASELLADGLYRPETFPHDDSFVRDCSDPNVAFADRIRGIRPDNNPSNNILQRPPPEPSEVDELELQLLRAQLEQMKSTLAQKEETITVLQNKLSAKDAECETLHNALQTKSSAAAASSSSREAALESALHIAEEKTAAAAATAAARFAIVKDALIATEDEAAVTADRCRRLEKEAKSARAEATQARKQQAEREALWIKRSEVLLAECERRGRAVLVTIGEREMPGVRDGMGRQAYRYQSQSQNLRGRDGDRDGR